MDNARAVRRVQRIGNLDAELQNLLDGHGSGADRVLQRHPVEVFHGDEALALEGVHVVNRADVGMIQRRSGARFALEALKRHRVARKAFRQELQRHASAETQIFGKIDDAHAAAAQLV